MRWRLLGATVLTVSLALVGAGFLLSNLFREHVTRQFDAQLLRHLQQLTATFELDADHSPQLRSALSDPRWQTPYSGLYWQIEAMAVGNVAAQEGPVLRSRSLWDEAMVVSPDHLDDAELHRHLITGPRHQRLAVLERKVRFVSSADGAGPPRNAAGAASAWRLIVAGDVQELEDAVTHFSERLSGFLALLGVALLAAAWAQVTLGLMPLRTLQAAVQSVRQGEQQRLQGAFPTEVTPLVDDFNRVLEQNQQVAERARQMAGNLAHAVKTPLAVVASLASDVQLDRQELTRQLHEQVDIVRSQLDWHLGRARSATAGLPGLRTPVQPVLEALVRVMRKVHAGRLPAPDGMLKLEQVPPGLQFLGENQDLQEMVGNLLDNACKWAHSQIVVRAFLCDKEWLRIDIEDDGPGLTQAQRLAVFERGVRLDERQPGTGLGLDIVREVVSLYRGEVSLQASALGGLKASLRLPGHLAR